MPGGRVVVVVVDDVVGVPVVAVGAVVEVATVVEDDVEVSPASSPEQAAASRASTSSQRIDRAPISEAGYT